MGAHISTRPKGLFVMSCRVMVALTGLSIAASGFFVANAFASGGPVIGWIHADTYAEQESAPARFWPGNLFDGRDAGAWCVDGGPHAARGQRVRVSFQSSVEFDRVTVRTGRLRPPDAFAQTNRVTRLIIDDGSYRRTLNLEDKRAPQTVQISPAVSGNVVNVIIEAVEGEHDRTCITGVVFSDGQKALNGRWMAANLRYHPQRSPLQGVWALGAAGSPERFLSLYMDGTFRYVHRPFDQGEEGFDKTGSFRFTEGMLRLQIDGQWRAAKAERVSGRDDLGEPYTHLRVSDAPEALEGIEGNWIPWLR